MLESLIIGGLFGLVTTGPPAVIYAKTKLGSFGKTDQNGSKEIAAPDIVSDTVDLGNIIVSAGSVYRKDDKAIFDLDFMLKNAEENVKIGVGIVDVKTTWIGERNPNHSKQTSIQYIRERVIALSDQATVPVPVKDVKGMMISHAIVDIYEGMNHKDKDSVARNHRVQLKITDYTHVDR